MIVVEGVKMKGKHSSRNACANTPSARCRAIGRALLAIALLVGGSAAVNAADLILGNGDSFDLGAGTLELECGSLTLQRGAAFKAGNGFIHLSGDWNNLGSFDRGGSSVVFNDGCGQEATSRVSGETHFHNLAARTTFAHELQLESGRTQTVANALVLVGSENGLLKIRSSMPGSPAYLVLEQAGNQTISHVNVKDNHAPYPGQPLALGTPGFLNSVDGGNNLRWFLTDLEPIPTLSGLGMGILLLLVLLIYLRRASCSTRSRPQYSEKDL